MIDWKQLSFSLMVLVAGGLLILCDLFWAPSKSGVWLNLGCSLLATAFITGFGVCMFRKREDGLAAWRLERVFETRQEKNEESDDELDHVSEHFDVVAFGLKSFREKHAEQVRAILARGVDIRILTMDPDSPFVGAREREEDEAPGQIRKSIQELVSWADGMNAESRAGKIEVRGYSFMTLDFYWRVDDVLCFGPYWVGRGSQQTPTFKAKAGGRLFRLYAGQFEATWNRRSGVRALTGRKSGKHMK